MFFKPSLRTHEDEEAVHVVAGNRAFSKWTFRGTDRAGVAIEVRGMDLFEIRDGLIARKDTCRKVRTG
nr:nuclear transport factor 2 family protein [Roseococcus sp. SDR]